MSDAERGDLFRSPVGAFLAWCLPLGIGLATRLLGVPSRIGAGIWAVLFVWMGVACFVNARRCHRLHCYISGPVFLLGAVATGLLAFGVPLGPHALNNTVSIALVLALLSFVPEVIWRRYA
jgi:hypothetical protein